MRPLNQKLILALYKQKDWLKVSFGGSFYRVGSEIMGDWEVNLHNVGVDALDKSKFHTSNITAVNFFTGNSDTCNDAMNMTAYGRFNGEDGYKMIFRAGDIGAPNAFAVFADTARVTIYNPDNVVIYDTHATGEFSDESSCWGTARTGLDHGNISIDWIDW